jgi:predicted HicB family RNase H-like nuclease
MRKTATLNLRVSAEFKKKLMEEAKKENRSVTNYLESTLDTFWKEKATVKRTSKIRE